MGYQVYAERKKMLEYVKGLVISCHNGSMVLEMGNVAFRLKVSTYTELQFKEGSEVTIFVSLTIRDDTLKVFGFVDYEEREAFYKLQTISGVGPSMALNILSGGSPDDLRKAILTENLSYFKKIKGVGPKTAKRIILELKGSIQNIDTTTSLLSSAPSTRIDGINALVSLGYNQMVATTIIDKIIHQEKNIQLDDLIKKALQES